MQLKKVESSYVRLAIKITIVTLYSAVLINTICNKLFYTKVEFLLIILYLV